MFIKLQLLAMLLAQEPAAFATWEGLSRIVNVLLVVLVPVVILQLNASRQRLRDGDKKFHELEKTNTALEEQVKALKETCQKLDRKVDQLMQRDADVQLDAQGALGNTRADNERHFATKEEMRRLERRLDEHYGDILAEIRKVRA